MANQHVHNQPPNRGELSAQDWYSHGREHELEGNFVKAQQAYEFAISLDSGRANWYYRLGCVCIKQDQLQLAKSHFQTATELKPNVGAYLTNLGLAHDRLGERVEAVRAYQKAIFYDNRSSEAFNNLGAIYAEEGRTADASNVRSKRQCSDNSRN